MRSFDPPILTCMIPSISSPTWITICGQRDQTGSESGSVAPASRAAADLISQQLDHAFPVADLDRVTHEERSLTRIQLRDILGGKEARVTVALALPPLEVRGVGDREHGSRSEGREAGG